MNMWFILLYRTYRTFVETCRLSDPRKLHYCFRPFGRVWLNAFCPEDQSINVSVYVPMFDPKCIFNIQAMHISLLGRKTRHIGSTVRRQVYKCLYILQVETKTCTDRVSRGAKDLVALVWGDIYYGINIPNAHSNPRKTHTNHKNKWSNVNETVGVLN